MRKRLINIIIFVVVSIVIIYFVTNHVRQLTPVKPKPSVEIQFNDIVYLEEPNYSKIMFTDDLARYKTSTNILIPLFNKIEFNAKEMYKVEGYIHNNDSDIYWSGDGKTLGILFGSSFPNIRYPAIITETKKLYTCLEDENLYTNYDYPIQVIDDERIVINIGRSPNNYLSLYNMKECKEESIFYDGNLEGRFSLASHGWLAIEEDIGSDSKLNIYDENRTLAFTDNEIDNYHFFTWSKDGNKLVYRVVKSPSNDKFYLHNFQTDKTSLISENIYRASFSPDGNKLVIQRPQYDLYILDLNTMEESFLTKGVNPDWRP